MMRGFWRFTATTVLTMLNVNNLSAMKFDFRPLAIALSGSRSIYPQGLGAGQSGAPFGQMAGTLDFHPEVARKNEW